MRRARLSALVDPALDRGLAERRGDPPRVRIEEHTAGASLHVTLESNWPLANDDDAPAIASVRSVRRVAQPTLHRLDLELPASVDAWS